MTGGCESPQFPAFHNIKSQEICLSFRKSLTLRISKTKFMARPIKDTPILKGKDAERFVEHMLRCDERKESRAKKAQRMADYESAMRIFVE